MHAEMLYHMLGEPAMTFFEPNEEFLKWFIQYVDDRPVCELGCGTGHFLNKMLESNLKAIGIEPRASGMNINIVPMTAEQYLDVSMKNAVMVAARPDHSGWVSEIPDMIHKSNEFIYISKEKNLEIDFDFHKHELLFNNAGAQNEKAWKIS